MNTPTIGLSAPAMPLHRGVATALAVFALAALAAPPVSAQEASDWHYTVGGGAAVTPSYEGSGDYEIGPVPMLEVSWRDMVSLSATDGLKIEVDPASDRGFYFSGGLGYWLGRREGADKDHGDALRGLGNLSGGGVGKFETGYQYDALRIGLAITRDIANDRDGTTIAPNIGYKIIRSQTFNLAGKVSATWADDNYMKNIFGITSAQAANSLKTYDRFNAEAGFKDVKASLTASYGLTPSLSVFATAEAAHLVGDAADSPIVTDGGGSKNQFLTSLGLLYRF